MSSVTRPHRNPICDPPIAGSVANAYDYEDDTRGEATQSETIFREPDSWGAGP